MKIDKTNNYDQFSLILGNRQLNPTHLKHLEASILKKNMLDVNPIIVNDDNEIVDGQHRLEVARRNNLTIYYARVNSNSSLPEVQLLNANLRNWTMQDYLNSYIELGNDDYVKLKEFCDFYQLPISVSMHLLSGKTATHAIQEFVHTFKEGKFKVVGLKKAIDMAEKLMLVKPYVEGPAWKDREFLRALQLALKKVGSKRLIKKLSTSGFKIHRQLGTKEYLRVLEDIYNHRLREESKIRFF